MSIDMHVIHIVMLIRLGAGGGGVLLKRQGAEHKNMMEPNA